MEEPFAVVGPMLTLDCRHLGVLEAQNKSQYSKIGKQFHIGREYLEKLSWLQPAHSDTNPTEDVSYSCGTI